VRSALSAIDGVTVGAVSKTAAKVTIDRSKVKNDQLTKAVTDAGFKATID
jgi:copper chaperone CopZ